MRRRLELEELVNRKIIARDKASGAEVSRLACELAVHYQQLQRLDDETLEQVEGRIRSLTHALTQANIKAKKLR